MNIFSKVLENWSNYELISIIEVISLMMIFCIVFTWFFTKDKRSLLFSLTSFLSAIVLTILTISAIYLLDINISETYSFVFFLTVTLSTVNIWTLLSFFIKNRNRKDFDIDFATREHFSDSLKLVSFICLFFSILIAFINGDIRNILISSGISSILAVFVNVLLARIFFKDKKSEK